MVGVPYMVEYNLPAWNFMVVGKLQWGWIFSVCTMPSFWTNFVPRG